MLNDDEQVDSHSKLQQMQSAKIDRQSGTTDVLSCTWLCSCTCVQTSDLVVVTPVLLQKLTCCSTVCLNLLGEVVNLALINSYFGIIYWHLVNSRFTLFRAAVRLACSSPMRVDAME